MTYDMNDRSDNCEMWQYGELSERQKSFPQQQFYLEGCFAPLKEMASLSAQNNKTFQPGAGCCKTLHFGVKYIRDCKVQFKNFLVFFTLYRK